VRRPEEAYPEIGERIALLAEFATRYDQLHRPTFAVGPTEEGRMAIKDRLTLLQSSITAIARELVQGMLVAIQHGHVFSLFLLTRAHHENTGFLAHALVTYRRYRIGEISADSCRDRLARLGLGRRTGLDRLPEHVNPDTVTAINVLTLIDAVDHVFADQRMRGPFRESYEWLSEFCHPNSFALLAASSRPDRSGRVTFERPREDTVSAIRMTLSYGAISHRIFFHCHDAIDQLLQEAP
jgi:hypothetical protein